MREPAHASAASGYSVGSTAVKVASSGPVNGSSPGGLAPHGVKATCDPIEALHPMVTIRASTEEHPSTYIADTRAVTLPALEQFDVAQAQRACRAVHSTALYTGI